MPDFKTRPSSLIKAIFNTPISLKQFTRCQIVTKPRIIEMGNFDHFRFVFLLITYLIQSAAAQSQTTTQDQQPTPYGTFSPSIAIIIIVLITALFFLGFFSIYIRNCSDNNAAARGGTVRPIGAGRSRMNANRGLDAGLIEAFPTFPYSEVKHLKIGKGALECAVCLNEFEDDETLRLLPKCDHVFHPECIDAWLASHTTCPVCRANLADAGVDEEAPVADAVTVEPDRSSVAIRVAEEDVADDGGSVNRSRPLSSRSIKSMIWSKFPRSHSTGHSLVQPGENVDRFTLKLPDQIRQEIMTRALNRTTSLLVLPRETSSRRGYRAAGVGEGSSRGKSYRRLGSLDRPDRWMFSMAPPFLARESSMKKSNRSTGGSEGTSKRFNLIGRLSFNRFNGSKRNEPGLMGAGNSNGSSLPV